MAQFVPVAEVSLDVKVLGDPLPVGPVVCTPIRQRIDVEILAVEIDALRLDEAVEVRDGPALDFRIAEVQQAATRSAQDPLGVFCRQPRARSHALGLVPEDKSHPSCVDVIGDAPNAAGKARFGSGSQVPVFVQLPSQGYQPASIHQ